jgi:hypothetical protein
MGLAGGSPQHAVHGPPHRSGLPSKGQMMKHLLMTAAWRKTAVTGPASHRPARPRRPAWPDLLPLSRPLADGLPDDDEAELDNSWFASSRALAQGLQVTEHCASLEVLLHRGA